MFHILQIEKALSNTKADTIHLHLENREEKKKSNFEESSPK